MMIATVLKKMSTTAASSGILLALAATNQALAVTITPTLTPEFASFYSIEALGAVEQIAPAYGDLTFKPGEPNTLLLSGLAATPSAGIYSVPVIRDSNNQITGFGTPSLFATAPGIGTGGVDAGLKYSPAKDVLFYTTYPDNSLGQIKLGSLAPDKQIDLTPLGIAPSSGALNFVPEGFAGEGRFKITSYTDSIFYDTTVTPDGLGTYDVAPPSKSIELEGGLDGFIYVKAGNPGFEEDSILITEFDTQKVAAYTIDNNGDPIANTRREFITGLGFLSPTASSGVMGATIDPVTNNFIFTTYFEGSPSPSQIYAVKRTIPPTSVPDPQGMTLTSLALISFGWMCSQRLTFVVKAALRS